MWRTTSSASLANFYPRPPRGGRHRGSIYGKNGDSFLSTPSARRATPLCKHPQTFPKISIHALREEGDLVRNVRFVRFVRFLSTPSARRATLRAYTSNSWHWYFYPRPPRGGRQRWRMRSPNFTDFYPRPPRGGRPVLSALSSQPLYNFYPRPPRGGRRVFSVQRCRNFGISIHALREEGDQSISSIPKPARYFYPRPPRGGRHAITSGSRVDSVISIHALREEGDAVATIGDIQTLQFLSTPSARRATWVTAYNKTVESNFYPRPPRGGRRHTSRSAAR